MKINEIFPALQGEGPYTGYPVSFLRTSGCNANCAFCDTKYHTNGTNYTTDELTIKLKTLGIETIVITGGEPMLQKEDMFKLMHKIPEAQFHLETNGSIYDERMKQFDHISCSPKKEMIKKQMLTYSQIAQLPNVDFKFVYESKNDLFWEDFSKAINLDKHKITIMPEGATRQDQLDKMPEVIDYCLKNKYKFGARMHVLAFNDKRGV